MQKLYVTVIVRKIWTDFVMILYRLMKVEENRFAQEMFTI